ncbi:MAG: hypothetical protein EOM20_05640 [Spartobacteria bacterium]|nr:hypothetical protein [Spartobacteria bacterium]
MSRFVQTFVQTAALVTTIAAGVGCAHPNQAARPAHRPMAVVRQPTGPDEKPQFKLGESVALPFYVLNNAAIPPPRNFALSGFMGDITDLNAVGAYNNLLVEGRPVLKFKYEPRGNFGWAGATWQNPANSWGVYDGGYNLSKAKQLAFWARGDKGGEIVEFTAGGAAANYPDSDTIATGPILLDDEWTEYIVNLSPFEMFYIATGFGLIVKHDRNPYGCVFYLDNIRYEN